MNFPAGLFYTKDHEWAKQDGENVVIGITDHAQDSLGEIVYVELPKVGRELKNHETFGVVESIKAVSDLFSPVAGSVVETNPAVVAEPSLVNREPYTGGWLLKLKLADKGALSSLMDAAKYKAFVDTLK
jgi:glycine cleavage system H protein